MTAETLAFFFDVHGNAAALTALLAGIDRRIPVGTVTPDARAGLRRGEIG